MNPGVGAIVDTTVSVWRVLGVRAGPSEINKVEAIGSVPTTDLGKFTYGIGVDESFSTAGVSVIMLRCKQVASPEVSDDSKPIYIELTRLI